MACIQGNDTGRQTSVHHLRNFNLYLLHYVSAHESCSNLFIQGNKNLLHLDSDLGNEFPYGNLLADVLLRSFSKADFQMHLQGKERKG